MSKKVRPPLWFSGQSSRLQNGDVLCLLWGTNWIYICYVEDRPCGLVVRVPGYRTQIYCVCCEVRTEFFICYVEESRPPLWSRGQSSWLQIQRPGFDSRCYQIFWEVVGLEWGLLTLVSTIEELLERKSSGSGLGSREYGSRDSSRWPRGTLYRQKFALTSLTSGCRSVGIVRSRTQATEFFFFNESTWARLVR
jgi:hypothetical protein